MGINIKNPETERLIRELAEMTGEGKTEAVENAVRDRIHRLQAKTRSEERYKAMGAMVDEIAPLLKDFDMDDALYGPEGLYDRETGLPK